MNNTTRDQIVERLKETRIGSNPRTRRLVQYLRYEMPTPATLRFVRLSREGGRIDVASIKSGPGYCDIFADLKAFTALRETELVQRLKRVPGSHFKSEFSWRAPQSVEELAWFYRSGEAYLFANAAHPFWERLEFLEPSVGRVLDYAGGVGNNAIPLAIKGLDVSYLEVSVLQTAFVAFRASRRKLSNVEIIEPYYNGVFDPIGCIEGEYGAIILQDVLEHIPDYHVVLHHLIRHLRAGGVIIENTPFDHHAKDIDVHLRPSIPLDDAMTGMTKVSDGVWVKK